MVEATPFRIQADWFDAPGVADPAEALSWAQLNIEAYNQSACRVLDARSDSARFGVFGSALPLAEWIVEHWWSLLHEPYRHAKVLSGRELNHVPGMREWAWRHCLLAARHGGALPDLTMYRDGDAIVVRWVPDPQDGDRVSPVQFLGSYESRLPPSAVEEALTAFVNLVLNRLGYSAIGQSERVTRLAETWGAIHESMASEPQLCAWAGTLGLDPYDPEQLTDDLIRLLEDQVARLVPGVRDDLLDAVSPSSLGASLGWLRQSVSPGETAVAKPCVAVGALSADQTAYELGYRRAQAFRRQYLDREPVPGIHRLDRLLADVLGWSKDAEEVVAGPAEPAIEGAVAPGAQGRPRLIAPSLQRPASRRFRLARAAHQWLFTEGQVSLITRAHTWSQQASRAFAAELLVPADVLRERIPAIVDADQVDQLAGEFGVSPLVIQYQVINHNLGTVAWQ